MDKEKRKIYLEENRERIKAQRQAHYQANKERIIQSSTEWNKNNKDKIRSRQKQRFNEEPIYKLSKNLRNRIGQVLKNSGFKKLSRTEQILGCTFEEFKSYLEGKFEEWMNWENRGNPKDGILELNKTWDIDHIIPLSTATTELELINLCHYSNLQPLCSYVNRNIKRDNT